MTDEAKTQVEIDASFIAQEHRILRILKNYRTYSNAPEGDQQKKAAWEAIETTLFPKLLFCIFGGLTFMGTVAAIYLAFQANSISQEQTRLMNKARLAEFLPDLYIEGTDYILKMPALNSDTPDIGYEVDKGRNKGAVFSPSSELPIRMVNLGRGAAKEVRIDFSYDMNKVFEIARNINKVNLVLHEDNSAIQKIEYCGRELSFDSKADRDRSNIALQHVLPMERESSEYNIALPQEYIAIFTVVQWCREARVITLDTPVPPFPELKMTLRYVDLEENEYEANYVITVERGLSIYLVREKEKIVIVNFSGSKIM